MARKSMQRLTAIPCCLVELENCGRAHTASFFSSIELPAHWRMRQIFPLACSAEVRDVSRVSCPLRTMNALLALAFYYLQPARTERSGDLSVQLQLILGGHRVPRWSGKDTQNTATFLIRFRASVNSFLPRKFLSLLYTIFLSTIKSRQAIENEPRHLFALFLCSSLSTRPMTGKKKPLLPRNEDQKKQGRPRSFSTSS